ncbi:MAG: neutral zinc metallopeptidase [Verrucomicrobiota bacterium]
MDTEGRRRSDNFEDRGFSGGRQAAAAGLPVTLLFGLARFLGVKGVLVLGAVGVAGYFLAPASVKQLLVGLLGGQADVSAPGTGAGASTCAASPANGKACDFSRVVLGSTEDVWTAQFERGALPDYGGGRVAYRMPTLVVFSGGVSTGGCGNATAAVGPFYCPADRKLYIDPAFYAVMEQRLKAPGDFAQAYVIAHEVGHHVQNLIGANQVNKPREDRNQTSVRLELQADCLAGVWGHTARASLSITDGDLAEALNAAHAIGDDTLGHANAAEYTHGTSAQRMRWFRSGFDSGDARSCDTFATGRAEL